jgi:hypothetical protein
MMLRTYQRWFRKVFEVLVMNINRFWVQLGTYVPVEPRDVVHVMA